MSRRLPLSAVLIIVLVGMLGVAFNVQKVEAGGTIYIRADGSIDGPANITTADYVTYYFNESNYDQIVVQRNNIIIDGNGYTLQGTGALDSRGIALSRRTNVTIKNMEIKTFYNGIYIYDSSFNSISGNNITNNDYGIYFYVSSNNLLQDNTLDGNRYGFYVSGFELRHYLHSINISNLVDGKPVYYLISQHSLKINPSTHPEVGFLALINSTNITVEDQTLTNNGQGIIIAYTNNTKIQNNNITNNQEGIKLWYSSNDTISGNTITANNDYGIDLNRSFNSTISGNSIEDNEIGIYLHSSSNITISRNTITANNEAGVGISSYRSSNNTIAGNHITNCDYGIVLGYSSNNSVYHSNFVNNTKQVDVYDSEANVWDNGVEGNYWDNYAGKDLNHDGIGDINHTIDANNIDNYPLMGPFCSFNTSIGKSVNIISNSTVEGFMYESPGTIRFSVSNMTENQTHGFCRVTIPYEVLLPPYNVTVNGADPIYVNYTVHDNGTHRWIYFEYEHSTLEIIIVPEFPSFLVLPLFMITILFAAIIYSAKRSSVRTRN